MIDRVRKSSGVIIGVVRLENDLAADLRARRDAVKFDLKADFLRVDSTPTTDFSSSFSRDFWKTRKSSSSIAISSSFSDTDNG